MAKHRAKLKIVKGMTHSIGPKRKGGKGGGKRRHKKA